MKVWNLVGVVEGRALIDVMSCLNYQLKRRIYSTVAALASRRSYVD